MYPYVYTSPNIHTQKILSVYITICIYICIYVHASVSSRHAHVRASRITSEGARTCTPRAQDTPRAQATPQSLDVSILLCSACLCAASISSNAQLSSSCPPVSPAPTSQDKSSQSDPAPPTSSPHSPSSSTSSSGGGKERERGQENKLSWAHSTALSSTLPQLYFKPVYNLSCSVAPSTAASLMSPPTAPCTSPLLPSNSRSNWSHSPIPVSPTFFFSVPIHGSVYGSSKPSISVDTHILLAWRLKDKPLPILFSSSVTAQPGWMGGPPSAPITSATEGR
mmetsp:Transcript_46254/g.67887  ORF Transcript_46254/g.67887 Transcript_46254/m.67887 type:complete len:280 (-) Transcript_46254:230-1069(-)